MQAVVRRNLHLLCFSLFSPLFLLYPQRSLPAFLIEARNVQSDNSKRWVVNLSPDMTKLRNSTVPHCTSPQTFAPAWAPGRPPRQSMGAGAPVPRGGTWSGRSGPPPASAEPPAPCGALLQRRRPSRWGRGRRSRVRGGRGGRGGQGRRQRSRLPHAAHCFSASDTPLVYGGGGVYWRILVPSPCGGARCSVQPAPPAPPGPIASS